jgi:Holliday junction resolvase RusA-like endonuclease
MTVITIRGEIHSSKNSRKIFRANNGRTYVVKSAAAKADEQVILYQLIEQKPTWEAAQSRNTHVCFHFIRKTHARFDFANIVQGIADAMVKAGYIEDDSVDFFIPVYAGYEVDKQNAGVRFWKEEEL